MVVLPVDVSQFLHLLPNEQLPDLSSYFQTESSCLINLDTLATFVGVRCPLVWGLWNSSFVEQSEIEIPMPYLKYVATVVNAY